MKFLMIFVVLAVAICVHGRNIKDDISDKDMFLRIIECSQKAIIAGNPDIGLPPHDPLQISHNFSTHIVLGDYNLEFALENMQIVGIPWWNVTQMDDITQEADNPVFNYTIYWKMMSFEGYWRVRLVNTNSSEFLLADGGEFGIELDHLTFSGLFNFSKPEDADHDVGFNELTLHFHIEDSEVHVDDLGIVSSVIHLIGGPLLKDLVNLDLIADQAGPAIRDKLNRDWVQKPERIEAIMSSCDN